VPVARIIEAADGHVVSLSGRELCCLDTPGHARHHICVVDRSTGGIFSGDMFGLSYREHDVDGHPFIFPTTTPTQFDAEAMHASIDRLLALSPEAIYLTHYSRVGNVQKLGADLHRRLTAMTDIALGLRDEGAGRHMKLKEALTAFLLAELRQHGCPLAEDAVLAIWDTDLELNAQGLEVWMDGQPA
jgi:glyoxylase-like metal-dependent hydrolase (beta-lactamase superfamily II)